MHRYFWSLGFLVCTSCAWENGLYVQRQKVRTNYLASKRIHTKDAAKYTGLKGENLLISWSFSPQEFALDPVLHVVVRLYNQEELVQTYTPKNMRGSEAFFFPVLDKQTAIVSYKIVVSDRNNVLLKQVESRLWVEKIIVDTNWL